MMNHLTNKIRVYFSLFILGFAIFIGGCSKDDNPVAPQIIESEVLAQYLEANGDYINTALPAIITAADVKTQITADPSKILILDLRDTANYNKAHIPGAIFKAIPDLPAYFKTITPANYTKIVLACYSGQSASYATSLLRLLGYNNVYSMKWGMCSWDSAFASNYWPKKISNSKAAQFKSDSIAKPGLGAMPTISTGLTDGKSILEARVNAMFAAFSTAWSTISISSDVVFSDYATNPTKNFVVNYWTASQYKEIGHVPGAYQYTPKSDLKLSTFLKTLPTDKPVVVYCFTGQTSAHLAAVLRVLGYDAKSISYGANGMVYDLMAAKTGYSLWKASECLNYPTEKN